MRCPQCRPLPRLLLPRTPPRPGRPAAAHTARCAVHRAPVPARGPAGQCGARGDLHPGARYLWGIHWRAHRVRGCAC